MLDRDGFNMNSSQNNLNQLNNQVQNRDNNIGKKEQSTEEKKEELAKVYGLSLSDIEQVVLDNGKEFFKFYNPKDQSIKMIENNDYNKNLSVQFKEQQEKISSAKADDARENAEAVFEYENKYRKTETTLIPIADIKGNFASYASYFNGLDSNQLSAIKKLMQYSDQLNLRYINIENAMAIDEEQNVINAVYNINENKVELKQATIMRYENDKQYVDENNIEIDLDTIDFDTIVQELDVASDIPIEIAGETIYPKHFQFLNEYSDKPELITQNNSLNSKQKRIYQRLIVAYQRYMLKKQEHTNTNPKVKVYTKDNKHAAFADVILLALLTGFFGGVIMTIVILFLKSQI